MRKMSGDEIKAAELDILSYIDSVCREHEIDYFLGYGTLLGAIRHKGFIPWDDDVDICMKRKDYERFIEIMRGDKGRYQIFNHSNNRNYSFLFSRVVDTKTSVKRINRRQLEGFGCWVDVFPLDNAMNQDNTWISQIVYYQKAAAATMDKTARYVDINFTVLKRKIKEIYNHFKYSTSKHEYYYQRANELLTQYNSAEEARFFISDAAGTADYYKNEDFSDTVELQFEGRFFMAPIGYDSVLKASYGNYMELPPVEKRISTHDFVAYWKEE